MRGVGGPLLCVGDLLKDIAGDDEKESLSSSSSLSVPPNESVRAADLPRLFEENYNELERSLKGTDHSWTSLTLKLCSALESADKLINSASSNVESLTDKICTLESVLKRGDSAVAKAKDVWEGKIAEKCPNVDS